MECFIMKHLRLRKRKNNIKVTLDRAFCDFWPKFVTQCCSCYTTKGVTQTALAVQPQPLVTFSLNGFVGTHHDARNSTRNAKLHTQGDYSSRGRSFYDS